MCDIDRAKALLEGHSVVCVRGEEVRIRDERGIRPLLEMIGRGESLCGFCVADKIVGKAAALLFSILQPAELYAHVLSEGGAAVLERYEIAYTCGTRTEKIVDRTGRDICPMEKTVLNIDDPQAALAALRETAARLRANAEKGGT